MTDYLDEIKLWYVEPQRECPQCGHLLGYRDKFCAECGYPWWPGTNPVSAARDGETWVRFYFSDADPVAECECGWRTIGDAAVDAFRAWWKHRASHYPEAS